MQSPIRIDPHVLAALAAVSGGDLRAAIFCYQNEPLAVFDDKTAQTLVAEGRADDVIQLLESYQGGFVG